MKGPFKLIIDQGDQLILTERAPSRITVDIQWAATCVLEKVVALKSLDPSLQGKRAYVDPVIKLLLPGNAMQSWSRCLKAPCAR